MSKDSLCKSGGDYSSLKLFYAPTKHKVQVALNSFWLDFIFLVVSSFPMRKTDKNKKKPNNNNKNPNKPEAPRLPTVK